MSLTLHLDLVGYGMPPGSHTPPVTRLAEITRMVGDESYLTGSAIQTFRMFGLGRFASWDASVTLLDWSAGMDKGWLRCAAQLRVNGWYSDTLPLAFYIGDKTDHPSGSVTFSAFGTDPHYANPDAFQLMVRRA